MSNPARSRNWEIGMMSVLVMHLGLALLATLDIGPLGAEAARVSFVLVCLAGLSQASIREWSLLILALFLIAILMITGQGTAALNRALDLAAFFSAFIVLLTLIKIAAERSPSVEQVGLYLTSQPQGRRFFATAFGSHVLGVFLNFAAISLMSPLIQRSTKQPDGTTDQQMERRQLSAMIRGFSWVIMWAPTTLTMAVIPSLFPQARWIDLLPYGLVAASIMVMTGWMVDRMEWRQPGPPKRLTSPGFPARAFIILSTICISFILLTGVVRYLTDLSVAKSLMFAAPVMTLAWFAGLRGTSENGAERNGLTLFLPAFLTATPGFVASATTLGLSGLVGILAGEAIPVEALGSWVNFSAIPAWLVLAALPVLITLGGQAALSPILIVVFLGELLSSLPALPADPVHIMFALSAGWALSMTLSPNASATLLISAITRIPPTRLTWDWNLRYGLICYGLFVLIFFGIAD